MENILSTLARNNINVMAVNDGYIIYEYQWRAGPSHTKWSKGVYAVRQMPLDDMLYDILDTVRGIRAELED